MHSTIPNEVLAQVIQRPSESQFVRTASFAVLEIFHLLDRVITTKMMNPDRARTNEEICEHNDAILQ